MRMIETGRMARPEHIDPGPVAQLNWLPIDDLVIDDSYQRPLGPGNRKAIAAIAARFHWSQFSPVFVAPVVGGKFAIIDGRHRTHAAALCGFEQVPCQIVPMNQAQQAASFAAVNGLVTKVTTWQIFKADLAALDPRALHMDETARAGGCHLMTSNATATAKKPGEIYGLKSFAKLLDQNDSADVIIALKALMAAEGYGDAPDIWAGNILFPLLRALLGGAQGLTPEALAAWLEDFPIWDAVEATEEEIKRARRLNLPGRTKKAALEERLRAALAARKDVAA